MNRPYLFAIDYSESVTSRNAGDHYSTSTGGSNHSRGAYDRKAREVKELFAACSRGGRR